MRVERPSGWGSARCGSRPPRPAPRQPVLAPVESTTLLGVGGAPDARPISHQASSSDASRRVGEPRSRGVPHPAGDAPRPRNLASQVGAVPVCANDVCRTRAPIRVVLVQHMCAEPRTGSSTAEPYTAPGPPASVHLVVVPGEPVRRRDGDDRPSLGHDRLEVRLGVRIAERFQRTASVTSRIRSSSRDSSAVPRAMIAQAPAASPFSTRGSWSTRIEMRGSRCRFFR